MLKSLQNAEGKKMEDLVSIIIPVYNAAEFLEECLNSVCKQSYKNIEIILIDDGSDDNSSEICRKFKCSDERILFIKKVNEGVAKTRNMGLKHASGKWVTFVDADDEISSNYIRVLMSRASGMDVCFLKSQKANMFDVSCEKSINLVKKDFRNFERSLLNKYACKQEIHLTSSCAKLYNTDFLKRNGIIFPENLKKSEDAVFNMQVYNSASNGMYYDYFGYYYRTNLASATHKYDSKAVETYLNHLRYIETFYMNKKYAEYHNDYYVRCVFDFMYCIANDFCHVDNKKKYILRKREFEMCLKSTVFGHAFKNVAIKDFSFLEKILTFFIRHHFFAGIELGTKVISYIKNYKVSRLNL